MLFPQPVNKLVQLTVVYRSLRRRQTLVGIKGGNSFARLRCATLYSGALVVVERFGDLYGALPQTLPTFCLDTKSRQKGQGLARSLTRKGLAG